MVNTAVRNARQEQEELEALHRLDEECVHLQHAGNYLKAFDCMERALVLRRHFFGVESPEVRDACRALAEMCNLLSMSFLQQDNFSVTIDLLKKAELLTQHHPAERATTLNNLACYYRRLGKLHTALASLKKALDIERSLHDVRNAADTHLNMCAVQSQLGHHDKALAHAQTALVTLQDEFFRTKGANANAPVMAGQASELPASSSRPSQPTQTANATQLDRVSVMCIAYHNIGVEQEFLKDYANSVLSYKKGVGLAEQYLGVDHPIATTIRNSYLAAKRTISTKAHSARPRVEALPNGAKSPAGRRLHSPRAGASALSSLSSLSSPLREPTPLERKSNGLQPPSPRSIIADALSASHAGAKGKRGSSGAQLPPLNRIPSPNGTLSPRDPFFSPRYRFDAASSSATTMLSQPKRANATEIREIGSCGGAKAPLNAHGHEDTIQSRTQRDAMEPVADVDTTVQAGVRPIDSGCGIIVPSSMEQVASVEDATQPSMEGTVSNSKGDIHNALNDESELQEVGNVWLTTETHHADDRGDIPELNSGVQVEDVFASHSDAENGDDTNVWIAMEIKSEKQSDHDDAEILHELKHTVIERGMDAEASHIVGDVRASKTGSIAGECFPEESTKHSGDTEEVSFASSSIGLTPPNEVPVCDNEISEPEIVDVNEERGFSIRDGASKGIEDCQPPDLNADTGTLDSEYCRDEVVLSCLPLSSDLDAAAGIVISECGDNGSAPYDESHLSAPSDLHSTVNLGMNEDMLATDETPRAQSDTIPIEQDEDMNRDTGEVEPLIAQGWNTATVDADKLMGEIAPNITTEEILAIDLDTANAVDGDSVRRNDDGNGQHDTDTLIHPDDPSLNEEILADELDATSGVGGNSGGRNDDSLGENDTGTSSHPDDPSQNEEIIANGWDATNGVDGDSVGRNDDGNGEHDTDTLTYPDNPSQDENFEGHVDGTSIDEINERHTGLEDGAGSTAYSETSDTEPLGIPPHDHVEPIGDVALLVENAYHEEEATSLMNTDGETEGDVFDEYHTDVAGAAIVANGSGEEQEWQAQIDRDVFGEGEADLPVDHTEHAILSDGQDFVTWTDPPSESTTFDRTAYATDYHEYTNGSDEVQEEMAIPVFGVEESGTVTPNDHCFDACAFEDETPIAETTHEYLSSNPDVMAITDEGDYGNGYSNESADEENPTIGEHGAVPDLSRDSNAVGGVAEAEEGALPQYAPDADKLLTGGTLDAPIETSDEEIGLHRE